MTDATQTLITAINQLMAANPGVVVGGEYLRQVLLPRHFTPPAAVTVPPVIEMVGKDLDLPLLEEKEGVKSYLFQVAGPLPMAVTIKVFASVSDMMEGVLFAEHLLTVDPRESWWRSPAIQRMAPDIMSKCLRLRDGAIDPQHPDEKQIARLQAYLDAGWKVTVNGVTMPTPYNVWWHLQQLGQQLPEGEIVRRVDAMLKVAAKSLVQVTGPFVEQIIIPNLYKSEATCPSIPTLKLVFGNGERLSQFKGQMGNKLQFEHRSERTGLETWTLWEDGVAWCDVKLHIDAPPAIFAEDQILFSPHATGSLFAGVFNGPDFCLTHRLIDNLRNKRLILLPSPAGVSDERRRTKITRCLTAGYEISLNGIKITHPDQMFKPIAGEISEIVSQMNMLSARLQELQARLGQ